MDKVYNLTTKSPLITGDLVVLKSGGPLMTVRSIVPGKSNLPGMITVDWFVSEENYNATYYEAQLAKAEVKE